MERTGTSIAEAFDHVWGQFVHRLDGLTDDEYLWEPVEGCWSIHPDEHGVWRIDGASGNSPAPEPAPITTIAWRIGHIAGMLIGGFADRLFGDGTLTAQDLTFPGLAAEVPSYCEANYRPWREGIETIDEERWWSPIGPKWGPYATANTVDLALHVLHELSHHGAEVGLLRDLYARRAG